MSLGKRIKKSRIKLGLSQAKLAKVAKMNVMTISHYETDASRGLRANTLFSLAAALETTPEYLMYGTRQKSINEAAGGIKKLVDVCKGLSPDAIAKLIAAAKKLHQQGFGNRQIGKAERCEAEDTLLNHLNMSENRSGIPWAIITQAIAEFSKLKDVSVP